MQVELCVASPEVFRQAWLGGFSPERPSQVVVIIASREPTTLRITTSVQEGHTVEGPVVPQLGERWWDA
jgi:hypothetical protein